MPTTPNIKTLQEQTNLSKEAISNIIKGLLTGYHQGLTQDESIMIPSFVRRLPTGKETGTYLAMDWGGTYLRVAAIKLLGNGGKDVRYEKSLIPESLKVSNTEEFFEWISVNVEKFVNTPDVKTQGEKMHMGVTFSFPINQTGIDKGTAMKMGKGFDVAGLEGSDVVELLNSAFAKRNLNIRIVAIVNDAIATLIAHAYTDSSTIISTIFGTGTNAACIVPISLIKKQTFAPTNSEGDFMVINTEWSILGHNILPFTKYDLLLDEQSLKKNFQPFEKMVSGYYLGELVRLTMIDFIENGGLFGGIVPLPLKAPYSLSTEMMAKIESVQDKFEIGKMLQVSFQFQQSQISADDLGVLQAIAKCYSVRAGQLAAAAILSLIELHSEYTSNEGQQFTIASDGSVFHLYSEFISSLKNTLYAIRGDSSKLINIAFAKDASSIGAAITAMLYSK